MITSLSHFEKLSKSKSQKKIVVAAAEDSNVLKAVNECYKKNIASPVLIGDKIKILQISSNLNINIDTFDIIESPDSVTSSILAVRYVKDNTNSVLMKGLVKSAILLKEIIKKDGGLLTGKLLSHIGLFESPHYHKIIGITDPAINIYPNTEHKIEIINNAVHFFNKIGYPKPKVALLSAIEKINEKIKSTVQAREIVNHFHKNNINNCIIDGPLALDNSISTKAAADKNIISKVAGDVDILVAPDIDSGNILYKSLSFLSKAITAGIILGASIPIIFTSRADSDQTKFMSIVLGTSI